MRYLTFILLLMIQPLGSLGAERSSSAGEDPIAGTLRLLENDISEEVILEWVAAQGGVGGALSSADVISLRQAGATDSLLAALLRRGGEAREFEEENVPQEAGHPAMETPEMPEPSYPEKAVSVGGQSSEYYAAQSPSVEPDGGGVTVTWIMRNGGPSGFDGEEGSRRRDFTIYLDGRLLQRLRTSSSRAGAVELVTTLRPGQHTIRVTRDLLERTSKKRDSWLYEVRVFPLDFTFDLASEGSYQVEALYSESGLGGESGPVTLRVSQGESIVAELVREGMLAQGWPQLCEALAASHSEDAEQSIAARTQSKGCLEFAGLWPEGVDANWDLALDALRQGGPTE